MANFKQSYKRAKANKKGYCNYIHDRGGETFGGICRNFHPDWPGWQTIDSLKGDPNESIESMTTRLKANTVLSTLIDDFYEAEYWNKFRGSEINNQEIAQILFDFGVNAGADTGVRYLQRSINLLIKDSDYPVLKIDGELGEETLHALTHVETNVPNGSGLLLKCLKGLQVSHYVTIIENDPLHIPFREGWLERL